MVIELIYYAFWTKLSKTYLKGIVVSCAVFKFCYIYGDEVCVLYFRTVV